MSSAAVNGLPVVFHQLVGTIQCTITRKPVQLAACFMIIILKKCFQSDEMTVAKLNGYSEDTLQFTTKLVSLFISFSLAHHIYT